MPYARRHLATKKAYVRKFKKFYRRKGKSTYRKRNPTRPTPFPPYFLTRMRYGAQGKTLTVTAGTYANNEFSANSLFDPDVTGVGHQPRYFDTLCGSNNGTAPYHNYIVYGCKAIVTFNNYSNGAVGGQVVVGYRDENATPPATAEEAMERANYKVRDIAYYSGGPTVRPISIYIPIHKAFGISKQGLMDNTTDYAASYNASPEQEVRIDIGYMASATSSSTIGYNVKLIFFCKFFNRNDVADS